RRLCTLYLHSFPTRRSSDLNTCEIPQKVSPRSKVKVLSLLEILLAISAGELACQLEACTSTLESAITPKPKSKIVIPLATQWIPFLISLTLYFCSVSALYSFYIFIKSD